MIPAACTEAATVEGDAPEQAPAFQQLLDDWRDEVDAYGATLSVRIPGSDDVHVASGLDDLDPQTPMPTDGTFRIASITKTFVAATALELVEEGRLSLTDTVEAWIPELPNAEEITLGMLLDHTAGLGDDAFEDIVRTLVADPARSYAPEDALAMWLEPSPVSPPGHSFAYSNPGYMAVGLVIERELDQDLATVIEERFVRPLELSDTVLGDESTTASRHAWFNENWFSDGGSNRLIDLRELPQDSSATLSWAAGGMISSSTDLLDWGEALYTGEVLGEQSTATMLEMPNSYREYQRYGVGVMGFCQQEDCQANEVELVGHRGWFPGSKSLLVHHLDSRITMIVNSNYADVEFGQLLSGVLRELGIEWRGPIE